MNSLQNFIIIILVINAKASSENSDSDIIYSHESSELQNVMKTFLKFDFHGSVRKSFALEALSNEPGNVVCSPISAIIPLAKLALGAEGRCETELLNMIGIDNVTNKRKIRHTFRRVIGELRHLPGVDLTIASKIFVTDMYTVNDSFQYIANKIFKSSVELINFQNKDEASKSITEWMQREGKKSKAKYYYTVQGNPIAIIINVVTFLGDWDKKFHKVRSQEFYAPNGIKTVPMMYRADFYKYASSNALQAQVIQIPYSKHKASFTIVLPFSKTGLPELINNLKRNPELLNRALKSASLQRVILSLPKFKIDSDLSLIKLYTNIGLHRVFKEQSGLTGIVKGKELTISYASQLASIEVNEFGTEAIAASVVDLVHVSKPLYLNHVIFNANHPFLFYINCAREQLFAGVYRGNK